MSGPEVPQQVGSGAWIGLEDWELDGYTIQVRLFEGLPESEPTEVWSVDLVDFEHSARFDFATMDRLENALRVREGGMADHAIRQSRIYSSWGADAAAQQLVLEAAAWIASAGAAGVVGNTVYEVLKSTVRAILDESRDRSPWAPEPVTRDEAVERARWHLIRHFELETDEDTFDRSTLQLVGHDEDTDGSQRLRFRDGDRTYEVDILDEYGLALIGRIGWSE